MTYHTRFFSFHQCVWRGLHRQVVLIQLDGAGVGVVNLVVGGLLYLGVYLTLAPILGAVEKQDIMNLRTLLGGTRIVAVLVNPVFDYESRLLSLMGHE